MIGIDFGDRFDENNKLQLKGPIEKLEKMKELMLRCVNIWKNDV